MPDTLREQTRMFSVERHVGSGKDAGIRKASVHPSKTGWTCFTETNGHNHEPQEFAALADAEQAALAFIGTGADPALAEKDAQIAALRQILNDKHIVNDSTAYELRDMLLGVLEGTDGR